MSKSDPSLLQVWTNTVLGEPFEPAQETVEGSSLLRRGENYGPQSILDAVKLLTAGVDVQGDRIEVQILWLRCLRGKLGLALRSAAGRSGAAPGLGPARQRAGGTLPHRSRSRIAGAVGFAARRRAGPRPALRRISRHARSARPSFPRRPRSQGSAPQADRPARDAGGQQLHRVRNTLRAVILATAQQRRTFDGFLRRFERLAKPVLVHTCNSAGSFFDIRNSCTISASATHGDNRPGIWKPATPITSGLLATHALGDGVVAIGSVQIAPQDSQTNAPSPAGACHQVSCPSAHWTTPAPRMAAGVARHLIGACRIAPTRARSRWFPSASACCRSASCDSRRCLRFDASASGSPSLPADTGKRSTSSATTIRTGRDARPADCWRRQSQAGRR